MKLLGLLFLPLFVVRAFFWELVGCGVLLVVGHFVVKYW